MITILLLRLVPLSWLETHCCGYSQVIITVLLLWLVLLSWLESHFCGLQSGCDYSFVVPTSLIIVVKLPFFSEQQVAVVNLVTVVTFQSTWLHFIGCGCCAVAMVRPFSIESCWHGWSPVAMLTTAFLRIQPRYHGNIPFTMTTVRFVR